jgi:hypothetical protein
MKKADLFPELLPCPWCGKKPMVEWQPPRRGQKATAWIFHNRQVCPAVIKVGPMTTIAGVVAAWNRRTVTP